MQLDVNVDCGCEKVDIVGVDVSIFSFCPPPVSQIQMLLRKERSVGRVSCSDKITKEKGTLASMRRVPSTCWQRGGEVMCASSRVP